MTALRLPTNLRERAGYRPETSRPVSEQPSGCDEHPTRAAERIAVANDFLHFLRWWKFTNRESGEQQDFATLWPGQKQAAEAMIEERWLFLLKAGKLGFTELECAFAGWKLLYRGPNTRVHLFSLNLLSAQALLGYVAYGVKHVPDWLGLAVVRDLTTVLELDGGPDDHRICVSYPATRTVAIDQSAHHSMVDELARMLWPEETWSSIESTVTPGGSVHILTRGAGDTNFTRDLWEKAKAGMASLFPLFVNWRGRPRHPEKLKVPEGVDPSDVWYAEREAAMLPHQLKWYAPETEEDALTGSAEDAYIQPHQWAACSDAKLPPLMPGDRTPTVLGVDAGVSDDYFAVVLVSRHPDPARHHEVAVRNVKVWKPPTGGGEVDFDAAEDFIRSVCVGGCVEGHPNKRRDVPNPVDGCASCAAGNMVPSFNVVQVAYDSYQVKQMMQRIERDEVVWCRQFSQGDERMEADHDLRVAILKREFTHPDNSELNDASRNAKAKFDPHNDTRLRIIKRHPKAKVDPLVATSMASAECLRLDMGAAA